MNIDKAHSWGTIILAMAGLVCVTVLAAMHDITGDFALVAIVGILGAGGVNTALSMMATIHPKVPIAQPKPAEAESQTGA